MKKNTKVSTAHRLEISLKKGKLTIDNEEYKQKLHIPNDHQLLRLKPDEIAELEKIDVRKGKPFSIEDSTFIGFVSDVSNIHDVNRAYEWVRYHNMNARHIICAFKIPGPVAPEFQDYEDNDEHNAGRVLLDYLLETEIENRAIFVARFYEGKHIGSKSFDYILDAAKWAMNCKPYNRVSDDYQFSWRKTSRGYSRGGGMAGGRRLVHIDDAPNEGSLDSDNEITFQNMSKAHGDLTEMPDWGSQTEAAMAQAVQPGNLMNTYAEENRRETPNSTV